jgi:hypothetical protein
VCFFVASARVRDLLLRAKHLFVAATFAYPMRAGPWAHRRREISLTASLHAGFALVVASRQILVFGAAILWPSLNSAAPRDDKRVIAMTNEAGRTDPCRPTAACVRPATSCSRLRTVPRSTRCLKGF